MVEKAMALWSQLCSVLTHAFVPLSPPGTGSEILTVMPYRGWEGQDDMTVEMTQG